MKHTLSSLPTVWNFGSSIPQLESSIPTVWKLLSDSWEASFPRVGSFLFTAGQPPLTVKKLPTNFCYREAPLLQLFSFLPQSESSLPTVWKHPPYNWDLGSPLSSWKLPSYCEAPFSLSSSLSTGKPPSHYEAPLSFASSLPIGVCFYPILFAEKGRRSLLVFSQRGPFRYNMCSFMNKYTKLFYKEQFMIYKQSSLDIFKK